MKQHTITFDRSTYLQQRKRVVKSFFETQNISYSQNSLTSKQIYFLHVYPIETIDNIAYYLSKGFPTDFEIAHCSKITFFYY